MDADRTQAPNERGFTRRQLNTLRRSLNGSYMRTRRVEGRALSYIEGWHAVAEANRIFGFDCWDRETVESRCVLNRETRGSLHAVYVAKVRITVRAGDMVVVREGYGTGESLGGGTIGEAHERALKMAETDATKRALATFGKPFGLGLYLSAKRAPEIANTTIPNAPPIPDHDRRRTLQRLGPNGRYHVPTRPRGSIDPELDQASAQASSPDESGTQSGDQANGATPADAPPRDASTGGSSVSVDPGSETLSQNSTVQAVAEEGRLLIEKITRHRDPGHLKFVAAQPCLICGRSPSDAHHLRFAQPRAFGRKVSDEFTVPLCRVHHRQVHQSGKEVDWWEAMIQNVDPLEIAKGLWEQSRLASQ
jgi:hypothetical protein